MTGLSSGSTDGAAGGKFRWPTSSVGIFHPLADGNNGRQRAEEFVRFAAAVLNGASYEDAKAAFQVSRHQAETRKSMLEEMGLLYVPRASNQVILTPVGRQLYDLLSPGNYADDPAAQRRINAVIAWALSNSQIDRPQSHGSPSPTPAQRRGCEIRPYAAAWQALLELDGWIRMDEFFGVLWHVHTLQQFAPAIEAIRHARSTHTQFIDPARFARDGDLMNPRIYWLSHLSGGFTILTPEGNDDRYVFAAGVQDLIETVLRFAGGCGAADHGVSFRARPYYSVEHYFEDIAGRACPEFLFSGHPRLDHIEEHPIAILNEYHAEHEDDEVILEGGPELCSLALNTPCYHHIVPDRLLRLAVKEESPDYKIVLRLQRARPINRPL